MVDWKVGSGVKPKTMEVQVVQLGDGSLMINCRDDRGGPRTVATTRDEGLTWPEAMHTLYDVRRCSGYSCLTPVGDDRVGVLYEGANEMFFLRFPLSELLAD